MTGLIQRHPKTSVLISGVLGLALMGGIWGAVSGGPSSNEPAAVAATTSTHHRDKATPKVETTPPPPATSDAVAVAPATTSQSCSSPTSTVSSAAGLTSALAKAKAGQKIALKAGTYVGNFVASTSGTKAKPIVLCGSANAVLNGGTTSKNYVFHIDHANYWTLSGFTVTNGQKGVVADGTTGSIITGLTVKAIGDEGIHLRDNSVANIVSGNTISGTGLLKRKFGEGIYIGSAKSNWCDYSNCQPDRSDRNVIENNTVSNTTAESVDIKEGTTGGILRKNTFNGTGMVEDGGDSWVDVKGNSWTVTGNRGSHSINDGFQTHELLKGWGTDNVFTQNTAAVDGPGYGFSLTPVLGNKVRCDNTVTGAAEGTSNVTCTT